MTTDTDHNVNNVCCANRLENVLYDDSWMLRDSLIIFCVFSFSTLSNQSVIWLTAMNQQSLLTFITCIKQLRRRVLLKMNYSVYLLKVNLDSGRK